MKAPPQLVPVLAYGMVAVILLLLLEVFFSYFTLRHLDLFRQDTGKYTFSRDDAEKFISSRFDPDLGWDKPAIARNYTDGKNYFAVAFGDSFTQGDEVADHETWQAVFEDLTGQAVLNLGVGGYGLDQAVLKFEKYSAVYPARNCILGINSETYRRLLSYQSGYYFNSKWWLYAFKPILIRNDQQFETRRPPCKSSNCLVKVLREPDPELVQFLETHDYWYRHEQEKPVRGFPYTLSFLESLPRWLFQKFRERKGLVDTYFLNEYSFDLVRYLILRFADGCRQLGAEPLVLFLNGPYQLRLVRESGNRWDAWLLDFLEDNSIPFVDTTAMILEKYPDAESFRFLAAPQMHFNAEGNKLIANTLADYFSIRSP